MQVAAGTQVTLTASAAGGGTFAGWNGGGCSGSGTCVVTVDSDITVDATFAPEDHLLLVTKSGTGTGKVTSDVGGIDCGPTCSAMIDHGTTVTLTATPTPGSVLAAWSGGGCSGKGTCSTTITAATTVNAAFLPCTPGTTTLDATQNISINYRPGGMVYRDNIVRAYNNPNADCGGGAPCDITGWYEFDLSSIPDGATITAMTLNAYANTVQMGPSVRVQYSSGNNWTRAAVEQTDLPRTNVEVGGAVAPVVNQYNAFSINVASRDWSEDLLDNSLTLGLDNANVAYSYAYFAGTDDTGNGAKLTVTWSCN